MQSNQQVDIRAPLPPFQQLISRLNKQQQWLNNFHENAIKPLSHFIYPTRSLASTLAKIVKKLVPRKEKNIIICSDVLFFQVANIFSDLVAANNYIDQMKSNKSGEQIRQLTCNLNLEQLSQVQLVKVPVNFFLQGDFLAIIIEFHKKQTLSQNENKSLGRFVQWYEKMVRQFNRYIYLPAEMLKKQIILSQYQLDMRKYKTQFVFGKKLLFITKLKKRSELAIKNLQKRKMKILQLIDGEKRYISKLQDYIRYIKKPIESLGVLDQQKRRKIFSTVQQIKDFHFHLWSQLETYYKKYEKYQCYGDLIKKNIPYFKLYIDYILSVNDGSQADFMKLQQENEQIGQICRKFLQQKEKKASDELTQPTFRIARYEALFNQIIKKTNPDHPDRKKMEEALKGFLDVLGGVNQTVDRIIRRNKLNQLNQQFGTQENPIFYQKREYLNQFNLFFIRQQKLQPIILFIFTDLLLIVEETSRKILKRVNIDDKYYVRKEQDNKVYRNVIKIHSQGFINLSAGVQERHQKKVNQILQILESILPQNQSASNLVFCQVLGTEQIGSTSFAKHTQYVVEVKFLGLKKLLHLRFSQVSAIVKVMKDYYKDNLGITSQENLKKTWFNNHKSKTIEDRKRTIQQILQKLFNNEKIRQSPQYLLNSLGLDPDYFLTARKSFQKSVQLLTVSKMKQNTLTKKQQKQAMMILCATQIKLGRDIYHDSQQLSRKKQQFNNKIPILINSMIDNQPPSTVYISQVSTVQDVCNKMSKLIGLRTNRDFRLFHEIGKKQLRVLDHEQQIMKIFSFAQQKEDSVGFLGEIGNSLKKIFSPQTMPTLIFKKYYFLPFQIEQAEFRRDLTRLRLIVYQVFSQIKDMKYQLTFDQYLLFTAMLFYIEADGKIQETIDPNMIHRIIPQTIFKLKNYTEQQWLEKTQVHLKRLDIEIQKIIQHNRDQLKVSRIKVDSVSKTALYFGPRHLCSQIVLNKIRSNPIYGSNLFYVQPYKSTYDELVKRQLKMAYNMWLAIKVQSLTLLTPSSKQTVLELQYKDIQIIEVYSQAIVFKMDDYLNIQYRLNTYQSFEISQLVKYNKTLNVVLNELRNDSGLISKAKLYKEDLLEYRNTYDKYDDFDFSKIVEQHHN